MMELSLLARIQMEIEEFLESLSNFNELTEASLLPAKEKLTIGRLGHILDQSLLGPRVECSKNCLNHFLLASR